MTAPADLRAQPTDVVPIGQLREHPENYNRGNDPLIADLLGHFGQWRPAVVQRSTRYVLVGNTMLRAARDLLGWDTLAVHWRDCDDDEARRILAADNRSSDLHETDDAALAALLARIKAEDEGLAHTGYDDSGLDALLARLAGEGQPEQPAYPTLADRFGVPPFTVLDGRSGPWQERKRRWLALGIRSELGRGDNLLSLSLPARIPNFYERKRAAEAEAGRALSSAEFARGWLDLDLPDAEAAQADLDEANAAKTGGMKSEAGRLGRLAYDGQRSLNGIQRQGGRDAGAAYNSQGALNDAMRRPRATPGGGQWQPVGGGLAAKFLDANEQRKTATGPHPGGGGGGAWLARNPDGSTGPADGKWASGPREAGGEVTVTPGGTAVGSSIFDPVLAELAVRWFSPPGGLVLDPFAGGSVRGIVATHLGRAYEGTELRAEQVAANEEQRALAPEGADLTWRQGDATKLEPEGRRADLLLTCPPYAWLERYSDDPADLSTMDWPGFRAAHRAAIGGALGRLADDRFAVWVVGEVRTPPGDGDGHSVGLVADTIAAFAEQGAHLYNELIYVTPVGSLAIRIAGIFRAARKVGRTHQHVLVFVKGDARRASAACGPVEVELPEDAPEGPAEADGAVAAATAADEASADPPAAPEDATPALTPVEEWGGRLVKRDDLFVYAGQAGGKVRTCLVLAQGAAGLVTASARVSPQQLIVASIAARLGVPARLHVPAADTDSATLARARALGAEVIEHRPGFTGVIAARARADAAARPGWALIPFGMECAEAVEQTAGQVPALAGLPAPPTRVVVPVGSGLSLAGVLTGLDRAGLRLPVLGVRVGADPARRLNRWAPADWRARVQLVTVPLPYERPAPDCDLAGLSLDPWYEAKCLPYLEPGDLLWVVGTRSPDNGSRPPAEESVGGGAAEEVSA